MKIGIVTFWDSQDNYGQLLQCLASQHYLISLGHDAFLIRYKAISHYKPDRSPHSLLKKILSRNHLQYIFDKLFGIYRIKYINYFVQNHNVSRHFDDFRNKYIRSSRLIYTEQDLLNNPPKCDILMCGSDQVWAGVPLDPIYFLQFGTNDQKRIALAASFGRKELPKSQLSDLKHYLSL